MSQTQVQIEIIDEGIQALLHEVGGTICADLAQKMAATCGDGYEADVHDVGERTVASAYTATKEAMKDNLENNTLLRAMENA